MCFIVCICPLQNSIVILDEGHNVEKICEDSASYSLTSTDVAMCIGEVTEVSACGSKKNFLSLCQQY